MFRPNKNNLKTKIHKMFTDFGSGHLPFSISQGVADAMVNAVALDIETLGLRENVPVVSAGVAYGKQLTAGKSFNRDQIQKMMDLGEEIYFKPQEVLPRGFKDVPLTDVKSLKELIKTRADWFDPTSLSKGTVGDRLFEGLIAHQARAQQAEVWFQDFVQKLGESPQGKTVLVHNLNFEASMFAARMSPKQFQEMSKFLHRTSFTRGTFTEEARHRIYSTSPEVFNAKQLARAKPGFENYQTLFREWDRHLNAKVGGVKFLDTMDLAASVVGMAENKGYAKKVNFYGSIRMDDYLQARFGMRELHLGSADAAAEVAMTADLLQVGRKLEKGVDLSQGEAELMRRLAEAKQDPGRRLANFTKTAAADAERLLSGQKVRLMTGHSPKMLTHQVKQVDGTFKTERTLLNLNKYKMTDNINEVMEFHQKRLQEATVETQGAFKQSLSKLEQMYAQSKPKTQEAAQARRYIQTLAEMDVTDEVIDRFRNRTALPGTTSTRLASSLEGAIAELDLPKTKALARGRGNAHQAMAIAVGAAAAAFALSKMTENQLGEDVEDIVTGKGDERESTLGNIASVGVGAGSLLVSHNIIAEAGKLSTGQFLSQAAKSPSFLAPFLGSVSMAMFGIYKALDDDPHTGFMYSAMGGVGTAFLAHAYSGNVRAGRDPMHLPNLMTTLREGGGPFSHVKSMSQEGISAGKRYLTNWKGVKDKLTRNPQTIAGVGLIGAGLLLLGKDLLTSEPRSNGLSDQDAQIHGISSSDPKWQSGANQGKLMAALGATGAIHAIHDAQAIGRLYKPSKMVTSGNRIPGKKLQPGTRFFDLGTHKKPDPQPLMVNPKVAERPTPTIVPVTNPNYIMENVARPVEGRLDARQAVAEVLIRQPKISLNPRLDTLKSYGMIKMSEVGARGHNATFNSRVVRAPKGVANSFSAASSTR